jgi:hypothetical protein
MMATVEERYKRALEYVLMMDVKVYVNYPLCCASCAQYEIGYQKKIEDYVFFVNEQGNALEWKNGMPYHYEMQEATSWLEDEEEDLPLVKYSYPATAVYFHHDGEHAARILTQALRDHGFRVEWDGTMDNSVTLHIDEWDRALGTL